MRRTPLSGGVQSATARHDLPSPAVAVRNLMEQARFAHLCTVMSRAHHRRAGFPFGSLVDFAVDEVGAPVLALSPLAVHCRNALSDPRCTLVVQMPGWGGLANARVTVFGGARRRFGEAASGKGAHGSDAPIWGVPVSHSSASPPRSELSPCEGPDGARAAALLAAKSATGGEGAGSVAGQFAHFRMSVLTDIYFVGGFGTVQWVDVDEYMAARPDPIVLSRSGSDGPQATLAALNAAFGLRLPRLLAGVDEAVLVSIDRGGADARVRRGDDLAVERLRFPAPVDSPAQAHAAVGAMLDAAAAGRG